jgi:hypothetical protein
MDRDERVQNLLRQLNAAIQKDPAHKLQVIQRFYREQIAIDPQLADVVLTVRSIMEAGETVDIMSQTEHLKAGMPVLILGMSLGAIASLAAIVGGWYAISRSASGATQMNLWGAAISTQSVGVALVFLGTVGLILVIRSAFQRTALIKQ